MWWCSQRSVRWWAQCLSAPCCVAASWITQPGCITGVTLVSSSTPNGRAPSAPPALLLLAVRGIDDFKKFDDRHGHLTGDKVLQAFSRPAREGVRRSDTVARWGGKEFAIILPETTPQGGGAVVERLRKETKNQKIQGLFTITLSGGTAAFPADAGTPDDLIPAADTALYAAKRSGDYGLLCSETVRPSEEAQV